jgi:ATP-dependent exoDNAse (exonuclease V) beta subunit
LKWWAKSGEKQSISTPDNQNAIRIMTIHKSKGLDFKVTILPFCDWAFDKKANLFSKSILWCEPAEEPFNELALLPVEYSSKLGNSIFSKYYFDELMHQYIDNLNVAYVAFTRARNELICFSPKGKTEVASLDKLNSLSDMILYCVQNNLFDNDEVLKDQFESDDTYFRIGKTNIDPISSSATNVVSNTINSYPSVTSADRLKMRHYSLDYLNNDKNLTESKLNYGIIMHEILCRIQQKSDQDNAIETLLLEGRINKEDSEVVKAELEKFWAIPETELWFSAENKVYNEATILTPTTELYRPDRVIINNEKAIVVDYKFGDHEHNSHQKQVKQYMDLISQMDYQVEGYICYVSLGKVVEVS